MNTIEQKWIQNTGKFEIMSTKVQHVLTATPVAGREKVTNKAASVLLLIGLFYIPLWGQSSSAAPVPLPEKTVTVEGRITYITLDQVYTDLGTVAGAGVGDTLQVYRRQEKIGLLVVSSVARKSSVCTPLVPTNQFQLGDRVLLEKVSPPSAPTEAIQEPAEEISETPSITARGGKTVKRKKKPVIRQSGFISYRHTYSRFSSDLSDRRQVANLQYGVTMTYPVRVQFWLYGRSLFDSRRFSIYQARAALGRRSGRIYTLLGRVFSPELAGVGATDGILTTIRIHPRIHIGFIGGVQPIPGTLKFSTKVKKIGVYERVDKKLGKFDLESSLAVVGQYSQKEIDREFVYVRLKGATRRWVRLNINLTLDLDRKGTVSQRRLVEPTSQQISLRISPHRSITWTSRYSARKQIIYQVSSPALPDSLFHDELRAGWYNSLQWNSKLLGSFLLGVNLRGGNGSWVESKMALFHYRSPTSHKGRAWNFQTSYIENLVLRGIRAQVGYDRNMTHGSFFGEYELYSYGFGKRLGLYTQHTLSGGVFRKLGEKVVVSLSGEYSIDGDSRLLYVFIGGSYRL
jgi:hypothetical protein